MVSLTQGKFPSFIPYDTASALVVHDHVGRVLFVGEITEITGSVGDSKSTVIV